MLVYIRGAGSVATGIAVRLHRAGCRIIMSEREYPLALRRSLCFSEARRNGTAEVEGITACFARDVDKAVDALRAEQIALVVDPEGKLCESLPFDACVDASFSSKKLRFTEDDELTLVGVGPDFTPGTDCHAAVETRPMGELGRAFYKGENMRPKGLLDDRSEPEQCLLQVPGEGLFYPVCEIGDTVTRGETLAVVDTEPVVAPEAGILMGILPEGTPVKEGCYCAEISGRRNRADLQRLSEEALAIGGGVLEAILHDRDVI